MLEDEQSLLLFLLGRLRSGATFACGGNGATERIPNATHCQCAEEILKRCERIVNVEENAGQLEVDEEAGNAEIDLNRGIFMINVSVKNVPIHAARR